MASSDVMISSTDSIFLLEGSTSLGNQYSNGEVEGPQPQLSSASRASLIASLRRQIESLSDRQNSRALGGLSTGFPEVDNLLPQKKIFPGGFIECLIPGEGTGGEVLSLRMAWSIAVQRKGPLVIIDPSREIYPPGLAYWGVDLRQTIFLHPGSEKDADWAIVQVLRCSATGALWTHIERLDIPVARRFQLAAEAGATLGIFVRPLRAMREISWAQVRFLVEPQPALCAQESAQRRSVKVTVLRAKGQWESTVGEVFIDDPADPVCQTFGAPTLSASPSQKARPLRA